MNAKQIMKEVRKQDHDDTVFESDTTSLHASRCAVRYALLQDAQELYKDKCLEFKKARDAYEAAQRSYVKAWQQKVETDVLGS